MSKEIHTEITIAAPSAFVFKALADFAAYPAWNPYIRSIRGDGEMGKRLDITLQIPGSGQIRLKARITAWEDGKEIRWKGRLLLPGLFDGEYIFRIEETAPGTVHFSQKVVFSGLLLPLLSKKFQKNREEGFHEMNEALKRLVEGQMLLEMESIDRDAPVSARGEIEIEANPDLVWELLTDIEKWPEWNPDVRWVRMTKPLAEGTQFIWKAGPGKIRSKIRRILPGKLLSWTGTTLGIKAVHIYKLEVHKGVVKISTEESWRGLIVGLLKKPMQKKLQEAIDRGLEYLKKACAASEAGKLT